MTQEEIIEYNKRCAEFLGYDTSRIVNQMPLNKDGNYCSGNGDLDSEGNKCYLIHDITLHYHYDWNWVMEVVEAIEKLDSLDKDKKFNRQIDRLLSLPIYTKKEAVVQAINEFLIWYNLNPAK